MMYLKPFHELCVSTPGKVFKDDQMPFFKVSLSFFGIYTSFRTGNRSIFDYVYCVVSEYTPVS